MVLVRGHFVRGGLQGLGLRTNTRDARKYTTSCVEYTIEVTEACEHDTPQPITHVETLATLVVGAAATATIQRAFHGRGLLPGVHFVDADYLDAPNIVASQEGRGVALRGPARPDYQWLARGEWLHTD